MKTHNRNTMERISGKTETDPDNPPERKIFMKTKKPANPFEGLTDRTPQYTVKEAADMLGLTGYTVRYYDNAGLIPEVDRSPGNVRLFSDHNLAWLKLIHCLRMTGLPIPEVRRYINMCLQGDSTIPARAEIISAQEKKLEEELKLLNEQMDILRYKKHYYQELLNTHSQDLCNPATMHVQEPDITPEHKSTLRTNQRKKR